MKRILLYVTILLSGGLSGCLDHRIPSITPGLPGTRLRVKSLLYEAPDNRTYVSRFGYDGQGRLSSLDSYQTPDSSVDGIVRGLYSYDTQNRLTRLQRVNKAGLTEGIPIPTMWPDRYRR